jgi:hypothetical protein
MEDAVDLCVYLFRDAVGVLAGPEYDFQYCDV